LVGSGRELNRWGDIGVYIYGGAWGATENVYMARVHKNQIENRAAYEFFRGLDAGDNPMWMSDITHRSPVFTDHNLINEFNGAGKASVIYNPGIGRYLLTVPHGGVGKLGIFLFITDSVDELKSS
jgi:hypothetical protein